MFEYKVIRMLRFCSQQRNVLVIKVNIRTYQARKGLTKRAVRAKAAPTPATVFDRRSIVTSLSILGALDKMSGKRQT
jgi:hypothetical protein